MTGAGRRILAAGLLVGTVAGVVPVRAQAPAGVSESIEALSRRIEDAVAADDVGGITAAVFQGDHVLWARGFGWADRDRRIPAGVRTIYRTGSISKSFTAVLMLDLVEDGVLALDDPVEDALPEVRGFPDMPADAAPITYRQLASHTAGLIREPELEDAAAGPIAGWGDKILASIPTTRFDTLPGARFSYSNIGYGTLGYALERAAGEPFMDMVEARIFEPLGMRSSTFIVGPELSRRLAAGYANDRRGDVDAETPAAEHRGRGYKVPNGGVYSTVGDLATFAAAVMGRTEHELLGPSSRAEAVRAQTPEGSRTAYGLGFFLTNIERADGSTVRLVGHSGSVAGYSAYLVFEPRSGLGVVMLRNYNTGALDLGRVSNEVLAAMVEDG